MMSNHSFPQPRPVLQQPEDASIRLIALTQNRVAVVDAADYEWLNKWVWSAWFLKKHDLWYAMRCDCSSGKKRIVLMHRVILAPPQRIKVDHFDGNGLNNRRKNLRLATHSQNLHNTGPQANNTSGFKGVSWSKKAGKWRAEIMVNRRYINLGFFTDKLEAAAAYSKAAEQYCGEFARTEPFQSRKEVA